VVFNTVYVPPIPFFTGLREKLVPKKAPPRASAELKSELRAFVSRLERALDDLPRMNELARAGVADGIEELLPAHDVLHQATFTFGDVSMENVRSFALGGRAFVTYFNLALQHLEEPK
jgi:hypothetical protein